MAKYNNQEKIDDYITLATVGDVYQARIKVSESPRRWKWTSTKIKQDGTKQARNKAIATAHRFQSNYEHRLEKGLDLKITPFIKFSNGLIKDWRLKAQINEALYLNGNYDYDNDYERIPFGKVMANGDHSVWRMNTYSQYRKAIKEFQTYLESEGEENIAINDIEQDLWTRFIEWRNTTQPKRSAGTLLKYKTALTKVLRLQRNEKRLKLLKFHSVTEMQRLRQKDKTTNWKQKILKAFFLLHEDEQWKRKTKDNLIGICIINFIYG